MKTKFIQSIVVFFSLVLTAIVSFEVSSYLSNKNRLKNDEIAILNEKPGIKITPKKIYKLKSTPLINIGEEVIYEDLTLSELTAKLNNSLVDTLEGTGSYFAEYTKNTGLDPYLAVGIVLEETGCKWGCSSLVRNCYNIGGIKGSPSCNGSSYKRYESLDDGIKGYLDLIYFNYYLEGLTTAELMNPKYAASFNWSNAVNRYIEAIRAN